MRIDLSGDDIKIYDFSPAEALMVAIHLEEQGIEFYSHLAENMHDEETRKVFKFLAEEERVHLNKFNIMLDARKAAGEHPPEISDLAYLADSGVFSEMEDLTELASDPERAMKLGVRAEKHSISFYEGILDHEEDPEGRKTIEEIIEQERSHLNQFDHLLQVL